jgi:CelD/BcsL family acetyltransferase involved in cellulose biosynthesis
VLQHADTERLHEVEQIDALAEEWDDLADRVDAAPWHRPGWMRAWWPAFGRGRLRLLTVRRGGALAAVAPFMDVSGGRRAAANWHTPSFSLLAADGDARAELCEQLLHDRPAWLHAPFLDAGDTEPLLGAAALHRYRSLTRTVARSPYVPTECEPNGLWRTGGVNSGSRVRRVERKRQQLEETSTVEPCVADGDGDLAELLDEGFRVESSGWKAERGTAIVSSPATLGFYTDVARFGALRGSLRLFFVRVDGRMASFELCLEENGRLYNLKGGHDPAWRRYLVGFMTHRLMIEYAHERGLESFEFLGSDAPHKLEWTHVARERMLVQLFAPTPRGTVTRVAYTYGRPAAKWLLRRT